MSYYDNEFNNYVVVGVELLVSVFLLNLLNVIVWYYYIYWNNGWGVCVNGIKILKESYIIYLVDCLDVLIFYYWVSDIIIV